MTDAAQTQAQLIALREGRRLFEAYYAALLPAFEMRGLRYDVWTGGPAGGLLLVISGGGAQRSYPLAVDGGAIVGPGLVATEAQLHQELAQAQQQAQAQDRPSNWWLLLLLLALCASYLFYVLG